MTEEELTQLRAYKPAEVARMLNIPITRLETWVRENRVPHERAGVTRGVEFSAEDIRWIGMKRPELMGGRRGGQASSSSAGSTGPAEQPTSGAVGESGGGTEPTSTTPAPSIDIAAWSQIRAHRPRPRST